MASRRRCGSEGWVIVSVCWFNCVKMAPGSIQYARKETSTLYLQGLIILTDTFTSTNKHKDTPSRRHLSSSKSSENDWAHGKLTAGSRFGAGIACRAVPHDAQFCCWCVCLCASVAVPHWILIVLSLASRITASVSEERTSWKLCCCYIKPRSCRRAKA